jgi:FtsH-binding integral membrane protein
MTAYPNPYNSGPGFGPRPLDYARSVPSDIVARFFNSVYAWMCSGLALTAVVAWFVAHSPSVMQSLVSTGAFWVLIIIQLVLVFSISYAINKISPAVATALFLGYAALNGATLAPIFLIYTHTSITVAFVATAGMFGAMSLIGFVTKRDLSSLGSILFMALIGLIIASVVNLFWANSALYWVITYAAVAIFAGLTAVDTWRLKQIALATEGDPRLASRLAIVGSLQLYLDFINMFLYLLRILGNRR